MPRSMSCCARMVKREADCHVSDEQMSRRSRRIGRNFETTRPGFADNAKLEINWATPVDRL